MKVGDRVKILDFDGYGIIEEIGEVHSGYGDYLIKYFTNEGCKDILMYKGDIRLDTEYYREERLKKLLDKG